MDDATNKKGKEGGIKRPPFVGLIAFLMGILLGIFIPLSRRLRKSGTEEK